MSFVNHNLHRQQMLKQLGIEQLPPLVLGSKDMQPESESNVDAHTVVMPVPGRKCPACLSKGETVWVIPGKCCPACGTPVN
ncbi:hypothetical protein K490DRAFT_67563 [Saccharata proteae CBS 121410]|uniref:Uncharacterized protein n=1 Tax=Saccharata proteae CBS 121410 TaxID=1314787 RepID=A0A9P4HS40_9PEZI|nr:hypothetical protein K490DRAFT_67563 [Saccharata proteae CBS 121410]